MKLTNGTRCTNKASPISLAIGGTLTPLELVFPPEKGGDLRLICKGCALSSLSPIGRVAKPRRLLEALLLLRSKGSFFALISAAMSTLSVPAAVPSPAEDAEKLHQAFSGSLCSDRFVPFLRPSDLLRSLPISPGLLLPVWEQSPPRSRNLLVMGWIGGGDRVSLPPDVAGTSLWWMDAAGILRSMFIFWSARDVVILFFFDFISSSSSCFFWDV